MTLVTLGPIVLSAVMMAVMAFTTVRVYRTHLKAMRRLEEYGEALRLATDYIKDHPHEYLKALDDVEQMRGRLN